jgi:hypothetical protein
VFSIFILVMAAKTLQQKIEGLALMLGTLHPRHHATKADALSAIISPAIKIIAIIAAIFPLDFSAFFSSSIKLLSFSYQ